MAVKVAEPPKGSLFSFKQQGCRCKVEKHYEDDNSESYWLQITYDKNNEVELYHDFKDGLYKSDVVDSDLDVTHELPKSCELKGVIKRLESLNVFKARTTAKIFSHNEEKYATEMKAFFEKYGFLFPMAHSSMLISVKEAGAFLDRIYVISQLISEIKNNSSEFGYDYNKIFWYVFSLSLSDDRSIHDAKHNNEIVFTIPKHPLLKRLRTCSQNENRKYYKHYLQQMRSLPLYEIMKKAYDDFEADLDKRKQDFLKNNSLEFYESYFANGKKLFYDTLKKFDKDIVNQAVCYRITDYLLGEEKLEIRADEKDDDDAFSSAVQATNFSSNLLAGNYIRLSESARREKIFIDFLYHFHMEIAPILDFCPDELSTIMFYKDFNLITNLKFSNRYKEVLMELAKETIKNEMDEILKSVLPTFLVEEMAPGWYVPNLYTAINYSLFLNSGNGKIEKTCANPTCYQTFSVERANKKKAYCTNSCSNCVRQRNYKKTHSNGN